jgi:hypothetical protein
VQNWEAEMGEIKEQNTSLQMKVLSKFFVSDFCFRFDVKGVVEIKFFSQQTCYKNCE